MPENNAEFGPIATWSIPVRDGSRFELEVRAGDVVSIVGANGSGKSALATWLVHEMPTGIPVKRVLAQRKIWFQYSGAAISAAERSAATSNIDRWDRSTNSRYLDHADGQRSSIALFDLLGHINHESRRVVEMYDGGATRDQVDAEFGGRLLETLNGILDRAGLHVSLLLTPEETLETRHRSLGVQYPVHLMSDGEKSALLLAAEVLTAARGSVIIIDEPERHLHRSVSAALIQSIVACRSDCAFVVLTHDLDLASGLSRGPGRTLSISSVDWVAAPHFGGSPESQPVAWEIHEVLDNKDLPEAARRGILGGRQKVLFIEGDSESLDLQLYRVLFGEWLIVPSGGCDLVIRSVAGLRASEAHHWIEAVGIVDGDGRSETERASLRNRDVYPLAVVEIENVYYQSTVIEALATRQAETFGTDRDQMVEEARVAALSALRESGVIARLAQKIAKDVVARQLLSRMPESISSDEIVIHIDSPLVSTLQRIEALLHADDFDTLIRELPIRDTSVRSRISRALGFQSIADYQRAALARMESSAELRQSLDIAIG